MLRRGVAGTLAVLACLLAPVAAAGLWARSTLLETDRWVALVAPIPEDPEVVELLADELTDVVLDATGVGDRGRALLEGPVRRATVAMVESESFARAWQGANRRVHARLVEVLADEGVTEIRLDLGVAAALAIAAAAEPLSRVVDVGPLGSLSPDSTPEEASAAVQAALGRPLGDRATIVLVPATRLEQARTAYDALDRAAVPLLLLALAFGLGALIVSTDRWFTGAFLGIGSAITLFISIASGYGAAPVVATFLTDGGFAREVVDALAGEAASDLAETLVPAAVVLAGLGIASAIVGAVLRSRRRPPSTVVAPDRVSA
jgi:hypothetical protein